MNKGGSSQDGLDAMVEALCEVLSEETQVLQSLDLVKVEALLARKRDAVATLQRALLQRQTTDGFAEADIQQLRASFSRLRERADENRAALEHALAVQLQVMQAIAQAVPIARADRAPIYQPDGSRLPPRPPEAYAFASRV